MKKKQVLIIGAGDRVINTILPAVHCSSDKFEIVRVINRSVKTIHFAKNSEPLIAADNWDNLDFRKIDLVIVAVTLEEVPNVLQKLQSFDTSRITLFLDTPVFAYFHLAQLAELKKFPRVFASEEMLLLPPIKLAKELIEKNTIGPIRQLCLIHFGYKYHALAVLKFLTNSICPIKIEGQQFSERFGQKNLSFPNGVQASMVEPQDYNVGHFAIIGQKGTITDFQLDSTNGTEVIGYLTKKGIYRGLSLNGIKLPLSHLDRQYLKTIDDCLFEKNLMKSLKVRAFMEMLLDPQIQQRKFFYPPVAAFCDQLAIAVEEKFHLYFNLPLGQYSIVQRGVQLAAYLLSPTISVSKFFTP